MTPPIDINFVYFRAPRTWGLVLCGQARVRTANRIYYGLCMISCAFLLPKSPRPNPRFQGVRNGKVHAINCKAENLGSCFFMQLSDSITSAGMGLKGLSGSCLDVFTVQDNIQNLAGDKNSLFNRLSIQIFGEFFILCC